MKEGDYGNRSDKMLVAITGLLVIIFVACWISGDYSVHCSSTRYPYGLVFMGLFQLVWSPFVIFKMRKSELVSVKKDGLKNIFTTSKNLALDFKKKEEFNPEEM